MWDSVSDSSSADISMNNDLWCLHRNLNISIIMSNLFQLQIQRCYLILPNLKVLKNQVANLQLWKNPIIILDFPIMINGKNLIIIVRTLKRVKLWTKGRVKTIFIKIYFNIIKKKTFISLWDDLNEISWENSTWKVCSIKIYLLFKFLSRSYWEIGLQIKGWYGTGSGTKSLKLL